MGTCYYLIRRDTRTAYALGESHFLCRVLDETPVLVTTAGDVTALISLILSARRGDLDAPRDVTLHRRPDEEDDEYGYWRAVALDVADWSEGQPVEFHGEHSELYEDLVVSGWRHSPPRRRIFRTGSRFDDVAGVDPSAVRWDRAGRISLARRRGIDEAFRRGHVWVEWGSGREVVLREDLRGEDATPPSAMSTPARPR